jgi:hypothetical protein
MESREANEPLRGKSAASLGGFQLARSIQDRFKGESSSPLAGIRLLSRLRLRACICPRGLFARDKEISHFEGIRRPTGAPNSVSR